MKSFLLSMLMVVLLIIGLLMVALPDHRSNTPEFPQVIVDVLDPSLQGFASAWEKEIGRRFPHSVAVLCHGIGGGGGVKDEWLVAPYAGIGGVTHIDDLIHREQRLYPDRTLVILCCNVQHDVLHGYEHVFYASSSVWCLPDRSVPTGTENSLEGRSTLDTYTRLDTFNPFGPPQHRFEGGTRFDADPDVVGNIFEFISAE